MAIQRRNRSKKAANDDGVFVAKTYYNDPVNFVKQILKVNKIEPWQEEVLKAAVTEKRIAVASGHGVGKTALTSWLILWFLSTRPDPQADVTANTKSQLDTKTWRELALWKSRAMNGNWFDLTATKMALLSAPDTWFCSALAWSEHRSEAFAGTHAKHVLRIFDEASGIASTIWDVSEGAMTTEGARWLVFGNPTRNTGKFSECWGKQKHRWKTFQVDSREVSITDKNQIQEWIDDYGDDSDFVRVRVKGQFPRAGGNQFISAAAVDACSHYQAQGYDSSAIVFGVDVARFGDDQNVLCVRQGRYIYPLYKWRGLDTMQTASKIIEYYEIYKPDMVFIDGGGVGGGVVDRVKQLMPKHKVSEVNFGSSPHDNSKYFNKRAEMWGDMRDAIVAGVQLPDDMELSYELTSVEYGFSNKQQIQLEKKDDMKKRGLSSPDCSDALALTFAERVIKDRPKVKVLNPSVGGGSWMGS